jgi:hypothetical protein
VAQERDQGSFPDACDSRTGCHQETWSLQGPGEDPEGLCGAQASGEVSEAGLALLNKIGKGSRKDCKAKKSKAKAKEATAKAKEAKAKSKEAKGATKVPKDPMKAAFQADLEKAKKAAKDAQGAMTNAASEMFTFYLNLLSPESKYAWNKLSASRWKATHL